MFQSLFVFLIQSIKQSNRISKYVSLWANRFRGARWVLKPTCRFKNVVPDTAPALHALPGTLGNIGKLLPSRIAGQMLNVFWNARNS